MKAAILFLILLMSIPVINAGNSTTTTGTVTLYTTSTFTTFVTTATLNVTSVSTTVVSTMTTSVNSTIGILGEGWNILVIPIVVFFGITVIVIAFGRRK